jgi:hypothetical protein
LDSNAILGRDRPQCVAAFPEHGSPVKFVASAVESDFNMNSRDQLL